MIWENNFKHNYTYEFDKTTSKLMTVNLLLMCVSLKMFNNNVECK